MSKKPPGLTYRELEELMYTIPSPPKQPEPRWEQVDWLKLASQLECLRVHLFQLDRLSYTDETCYKVIVKIESMFSDPVPEGEEWKTVDWLDAYSMMKVLRAQYRQVSELRSYEIAEIENLIKKMEFMFREEPSNSTRDEARPIPPPTDD